MGVVNTLNTNLTNLNASPVTLPQASLFRGRVRAQFGTVAVASGDDDGSVYRNGRVYSTWRIVSIKTFCTAITSGTDYDLGLYDIAANGGAVVDANAYADAVDLSSAITVGTEHMFEIRAITKLGQTVWEDAGATADTEKFYDVAYTSTTNGTADGTIATLILHSED